MGFFCFFFFSSRRRHTRLTCDWSSDVCSSDLFRISPWTDAKAGPRKPRCDAPDRIDRRCRCEKLRTMLLSCGDALIDFLPVKSLDGRDASVPVAGGSCLNIAVGMARLGAPAGVGGGISTDLFGRIIADHALASKVDLRYATRSEHQTTLAFVRHVGREPQY